MSSKFADVCEMFKDTWNNWGMPEEEAEDDDAEELGIDDEDGEFVIEEIVEGDDADDEEFDPEEYSEVDYDEFTTKDRRLLKRRGGGRRSSGGGGGSRGTKRVRVAYTASRSSYTKTTKTNVYYKPPVVKKVYVPPVYKKVATYVPPKPKPVYVAPAPKVVYKKPANTYVKPAYVAPKTVYRPPPVKAYVAPRYVPPPKSYYVRPKTNVYAPKVYYKPPRTSYYVAQRTTAVVASQYGQRYRAPARYVAPRTTVVVAGRSYRKPVTEKCTPAVYNPTYNAYTPGGSYSYQYKRYIAGYCSPASKGTSVARSGYYKKTVYRKRITSLRTGRLCSGKAECASYCCKSVPGKRKAARRTRYNTKYRKTVVTEGRVRDYRTFCRPGIECSARGGGDGGAVGAIIGLCCCCCIVGILWKVCIKDKQEEED